MKRFVPLSLSLVLLASYGSAAPQPPAKKSAAKKSTVKKPAAKPTTKSKPAPTKKPVVMPAKTPAPEPIAQAPVETGPKTWALLVGVSRYQNDQISSLRFPAKDAAGLREALVDPKLGGLAPQQVMMLTDAEATREKIMGAVGSFLRPNVKKGDKVVVFLAGHGVAKGVGVAAKSYLLPSDAKGLTTQALETSAVPLRSLADDLATLPASQFVVFVDACREDPTPGRGLKGNGRSDVMSRAIAIVPQNEGAQSATFFACGVGQRAFEDDKFGHGVFTNWILDGLRQGAIAQKPDGAIDMGRLSSYVINNVKNWAKDTSASGDFEVEQTPELIATQLSQPLVLMHVKRPLSDETIAPGAPRLLVAAFPEGAQVSINGTRAGVGFVEKSVPNEGDYTVTVSAPGYAPVSRSVKAIGGYDHQIEVQLQPTAPGGVTGAEPTAPDSRAAEFYKRALEAQAREQWEVAEQGLTTAISADAKYFAAYEALYDLHQLQNRNLDAIADAIALFANAPRSAHTLSLLSRAYSHFATKDAGESNATTTRAAVAGYGLPKNVDDAAKLAVKAANEAVALEANSAAAHLAQGYALSALDAKGRNKRAALAAFGKAAFLDSADAANHLGLGYGIRFYAVQLKKEEEKRAELQRAVTVLNEATKLRPNYYPAHRELAFCYIALEDTPAALRECRLAKANRGAASDSNEIASVDVAMSGLHQKAAQNATGTKKAAHEEASKGYLAEAKESKPDLKLALAILNGAGVSTSLTSYLPSELRVLFNPRGVIQDKINEKTGGLGGMLGGIFGR